MKGDTTTNATKIELHEVIMTNYMPTYCRINGSIPGNTQSPKTE